MTYKKHIHNLLKKIVVMLFLLFNFLLAFSPFVNASMIGKIIGKDVKIQVNLSDWDENSVNKQIQANKIQFQVKNKQNQIIRNIQHFNTFHSDINLSKTYEKIKYIEPTLDPAHSIHLFLYHLF